MKLFEKSTDSYEYRRSEIRYYRAWRIKGLLSIVAMICLPILAQFVAHIDVPWMQAGWVTDDKGVSGHGPMWAAAAIGEAWLLVYALRCWEKWDR